MENTYLVSYKKDKNFFIMIKVVFARKFFVQNVNLTFPSYDCCIFDFYIIR